MKILLVHPPQFYMAKMPGPEMVFKSSFYAPLGLLYVAAFVREHTDHDVHFFDFELGCTSVDDIRPILSSLKPDVVGVTGYTFAFYDTLSVCKVAREECPEAKIVMGGPHVDLYPNQTLAHPEIDFLVKGEGEETFVELLQQIEGPEHFECVKGLYLRKAGNVIYTGDRPQIKDLNQIPFPDRTLLGNKPYHTIVNPHFRETSIISSRGCPYRCNFCNVFEKKYRYRSAANIIDEMALLEQSGYDYVHFFDDTFNLFERKVIEMCEAYIDRGLTIEWAFRGRVDKVSDKMFKLLKQANCRRVYFGVEAGTDEILASTGKMTTLAQARTAFGLAHKFDLEIMAYFMIGFPDETENHINQTIQTAIDLGPNYVQVLITTPLPGTSLYEDAIMAGGLPGDYFENYVLNPTPAFRMIPWNKHLSEERLVMLSQRFYRKFYLRPIYMIRRLLEIRSAVELFRKSLAAASLVGFQLQKLLPRQQ